MRALVATVKYKLNLAIIDVYTKQVRPITEFAAPVWNSSITIKEVQDIERVQKSALKIILADQYTTYTKALKISNLEELKIRRRTLSLKFALKCEKSDKFMQWFVPNEHTSITRSIPNKYCKPAARTARFEKSPLHYLTNLLNEHYKH